MVDDAFLMWRLLASHRLMTACLCLGRLASLQPDSRARLARVCFERLRTHGVAVLQSAQRTAPLLVQVQGSADQSAETLLTQLEVVGQILEDSPRGLRTEATALLPPDGLVAWLKAGTALALALQPQGMLLRCRCRYVLSRVGCCTVLQCVDRRFLQQPVVRMPPALPAVLPRPCYPANWSAAGADVKEAISMLARVAFNLFCVSNWGELGTAVAADTQLSVDLAVLLQAFVAGTAAALR